MRALDEGSSYRAQSSEPHCAGMGATVGAQEYALCRAVPPAELRVCGWRGRLRVTRDVRVGCATELVPCANGWVGSRVRECGVRVLPYNEIMQGVPQEEDDLKLQFIIAGAGKARRRGHGARESGRARGLPAPRAPLASPRCAARVAGAPGRGYAPHACRGRSLATVGGFKVSTISITLYCDCRRVVCRAVDVVCIFARATRAAAVAARAPVPTSARPVPSRPDSSSSRTAKVLKVITRLTGRGPPDAMLTVRTDSL